MTTAAMTPSGRKGPKFKAKAPTRALGLAPQLDAPHARAESVRARAPCPWQCVLSVCTCVELFGTALPLLYLVFAGAGALLLLLIAGLLCCRCRRRPQVPATSTRKLGWGKSAPQGKGPYAGDYPPPTHNFDQRGPAGVTTNRF
mmetsp:Transcript_72117/g.191669  ORF Transcript_72117/g.191669 Transcript_72117/m.191669 type:complete len:144 (-) Transcript_72117:279-710(-)